jgi:hypothetical protein
MARGRLERCGPEAAIQWTVGTYDNLLEDKMGRTILGSAYRPDAPTVDGETAYKELTEVVNSKEGRIALQRHRTGQSLNARQAAIVARHDALERQTMRSHAPKER